MQMARSPEIHITQELGRAVAHARTKRGLSQRNLAKRLGYPVSAIESIERGGSLPRFRIVALIAQELEIPLRDLLGQIETDPHDHSEGRLFQAQLLLNQLSPEFLEIAIEQLSVLANRGRQSGPDGGDK